jgi:hypothetical protein
MPDIAARDARELTRWLEGDRDWLKIEAPRSYPERGAKPRDWEGDNLFGAGSV